jgi:hypothetical protein
MQGVEIAGVGAVEMYVNRKFLALIREIPSPYTRGPRGNNRRIRTGLVEGLARINQFHLFEAILNENGNSDSIKLVHSYLLKVQSGIAGSCCVRIWRREIVWLAPSRDVARETTCNRAAYVLLLQGGSFAGAVRPRVARAASPSFLGTFCRDRRLTFATRS